VSASQGAASGRKTNPFSIVAVSACRRMILSPCGEMRVAREHPAAISSWMSCVPEALSSIRIAYGEKRAS